MSKSDIQKNVENSFVNEKSINKTVEMIKETTKKVLDVLLCAKQTGKKAIINSEIGFGIVKEKFEDKKFPEKQKYKDMNEIVDMILKV